MISNEIVSNYDDTVARNVDVSFVPDLVHNGWAISTDRPGHIDCSMGHIVRAISEAVHIDWRPSRQVGGRGPYAAAYSYG